MYIDLFCALFLIFGSVSGYFKGSIRALLGVASLLLGIFLALKIGPLLEDFIQRAFNTGPTLSLIIAVVLCFLLVFWGVRLLASSLDKKLKKTRLHFLNKILGAMIMAAMMVLIYSSILWFMDMAYLLSDQQKASSESYPFLQKIPGQFRQLLLELEPWFRAFSEKLENISKQGE